MNYFVFNSQIKGMWGIILYQQDKNKSKDVNNYFSLSANVGS